MGKLLGLFRVDTDNPDLLRAQVAAFSRQMPLLYFILMVNASALSYTHYAVAPLYMTVLIPAPLMVLSIVRALWWYRVVPERMTDRQLGDCLKATVRLAGGLSTIFFFWALSLYPFGDDRMQGHVTFFVGLTMISCIFCMLHVRAVALVTTLAVSVPFTIFMFATQQKTHMAIGLNVTLVVVTMTYILMIISNDFERMINSQAETKRLSDENAKLANIDSLTGLPNRRQFFSQLNTVVAENTARSKRFAIGVLDLDGFKPVNDLYGHVAGDAVLTETGRRLQSLAGDDVFVARLGGDEFGIIMNDIEDASLIPFGEDVCTALKLPFTLSSGVAHVSASIGFAVFPDAAPSAELLFERADYALYNAKNEQRGRTVIFSQAHEDEIRNQGLVEQCLRHADLEAEMSLHFQPLIDTAQDKLIGFEALARWQSVELGFVPPYVFIEVAERTDIINKLTQVLLGKALAEALTWPEHLRISFNLSARDIMSSEAILQIIAIVNRSGIAPSRITFEVTESSMMNDFTQARDALRTLKALGAKISLDDFGTGYSSLSHVHRLPLDSIKVDRGFILDIETRASGRKLVKSVLDMCHNLDINCVVEGMESAEQVRILHGLGCTTMQGYYFSKPIPSERVPDFLSQDTWAAKSLLARTG